MRGMVHRSRLWFYTVVAGGTVFLLEGCDPGVRDTVLAGVGSAADGLASTFIAAFIESLNSDEETATTVRSFIEMVPQYFT